MAQYKISKFQNVLFGELDDTDETEQQVGSESSDQSSDLHGNDKFPVFALGPRNERVSPSCILLLL